jgi:hypothetical protein
MSVSHGSRPPRGSQGKPPPKLSQAMLAVFAHVDQDQLGERGFDSRLIERPEPVPFGDDNRRVGTLEAGIGGSVRLVDSL